MKKPILSVCIPTYNRREILMKTLERLIKIYELSEKNFEICISDNNSKDGTFKMLRGYTKRYPFIKIKKNKENLGFDYNLIKSLKMARGKYCWAMGDDDPPQVSSLLHLLRGLMKKEEFIFGLSGVVINKIFKKEIYTSEDFIKLLIRIIKKERKFFNFYKESYFLGSISTYFFNTSLLKDSLINLRVKKEGWVHLQIALYIISNFNGSVLINDKPLHKKEEVGISKKIFLPGEEFEVFILKRRKNISNVKTNPDMTKEINIWIRKRAGYIFFKSILQLFLISKIIKEKDSKEIEDRIYNGLKEYEASENIFLAVFMAELLRKNSFFKNIFSYLYKRIRPNFFILFEEYYQGRIATNEEREK